MIGISVPKVGAPILDMLTRIGGSVVFVVVEVA